MSIAVWNRDLKRGDIRLHLDGRYEVALIDPAERRVGNGGIYRAANGQPLLIAHYVLDQVTYLQIGTQRVVLTPETQVVLRSRLLTRTLVVHDPIDGMLLTCRLRRNWRIFWELVIDSTFNEIDAEADLPYFLSTHCGDPAWYAYVPA